MNDLREQLAARFANIFFPRVTDALPYAGLANFQKQAWRELADECIRQMRWTAAEVAHEYRSSEGFDRREGAEQEARVRSLTLAPEDWKP